MKIAYEELYHLESHILPLMFLTHQEYTKNIIAHFGEFCHAFAPSFSADQFKVCTRDTPDLQSIQYQMSEEGKDFVCFEFPMEDSWEYEGLSKYSVLFYNTKHNEIMYCSYDLIFCHNGCLSQWYPILYQYHLRNENGNICIFKEGIVYGYMKYRPYHFPTCWKELGWFWNYLQEPPNVRFQRAFYWNRPLFVDPWWTNLLRKLLAPFIYLFGNYKEEYEFKPNIRY